MRGLISFVVVAVTVVFQLTVVDRIAFPGGAGPDLVLLVVAALALACGPMAGVLTGFWAGLALDVAPPGSHFTGQDALVFCLVGYACGLLADESSGDGVAEPGHSALFEIVVTGAGAVCGEALAALLGVMLSDPRVTWPAITSVLPAAVAYDVLLCPFVLYAAAAALRLAGARGQGHRAGWSASQARIPMPGASQGAIRQLARGNGPRLRLSEGGPGSIGGLRGPGSGGRPAARREPQLKLGRPAKAGQRTSMTGGLGAAFAAGGQGAGPAKIRFGSSGMGRSLLGGSVFSRSSAPLGRGSLLGRPASRFGPAAFGRPAPLGRSSPLRHRGHLMRSAGGGLTGHAPRFSRSSSLARLTGALRRSAARKSPGRGWLRGASSRGHSLGRASLGRASLGRASLGRASLGRASLGRASLGRASLGRSTMGRGAFGRRGTGWAGRRTPRLKARRSGEFGIARLRMPRPGNLKAKRRRRTGGYR